MCICSPVAMRASTCGHGWFAPLGIPEDPATGSANCALAGLLALRNDDARAEKKGGEVTGTWIGGCSVMVADGQIEVG